MHRILIVSEICPLCPIRLISDQEAVRNAGRFLKEVDMDVKTGAFPADDHVYHIKKGKEEEFYEMLKEFE